MNKNSKIKICIIAGPTATGKSDVAIAVAHALNGEIISADSAQIYKYMDIGTAKLLKEEMQGINHYMIDEIYPDQPFSVSKYKKKAEEYIEHICENGKLPIIAGGTGLYINSLLNDFDFSESVSDEQFRNEMQQIVDEKGAEYVHKMLEKIDKESSERLHFNDTRRIIRALEVFKVTGKTITEFQIESKDKPSKYEFAFVGLTMDRKLLYERIEKRVDIMIEKDLLNEVKNLLSMGYNKNLVSMKAIGYKELADYLDGVYTWTDVIDLIKKNSRHYAKRQLTWFRRDERITWFDVNIDEKSRLVLNIIKHIAGKIDLL